MTAWTSILSVLLLSTIAACSSAPPVTGDDAMARADDVTPEASVSANIADYEFNSDGTFSGTIIFRGGPDSEYAKALDGFTVEEHVKATEETYRRAFPSARCTSESWEAWSVRCTWANEYPVPGSGIALSLQEGRLEVKVSANADEGSYFADVRMSFPGPILSIEGTGANMLRDERSLRFTTNGPSEYTILSER